MNPMKTWPFLIAAVVLLILLWQVGTDPVVHRPLVPPEAPRMAPATTGLPASAALENSPAPAGASAEARPRARVYRLLADGGQFTLEAVDEVQGDFRQPRAKASGSGVLSCRLVSDQTGLLASTEVAAPLEHCRVLDPAAAGAVDYLRPAPQVMQVRLPVVEGADRLEIHGTAQGPGSAVTSRLLASIPLGAK
jgi:hypothetical protein